MKKSFVKLISAVLCVFMMSSLLFSVSAESNVKISLFGETVEFPEGYGKPFIDASTSRTLVPARGVFEAMKADVSWDGATRTVTIKKDTDEIKIVIDALTASKNGETISLDQPAVILGDRTYIPLRFVAESLNLDVDFDGATTTVIIKEKAAEKKIFEAGSYKVGSDIKAAEYLLVSEGDAEIKLLRAEDSTDITNVISKINFKNSIYVSFIGANYIETTNCTAYSLDSIPERGQSGVYKNGMFKTGLDFAADKYTVKRISSAETASYRIFASPYSTAGTNDATVSDVITKEKTVSLKEGQYITLENAQLVKYTASAVVSGGGSSGGGSSRPSGGSSRPSGSQSTTEPTEAPTETPTEAPTEAPTEEPSQEPAVSENEYYEGYEGEVLDFGNFFSLPCLSAEDIVDEGKSGIVYTYDIFIFMETGEFDKELLKTYLEGLQRHRFGETSYMGQIKNSHYMSSPASGVEVQIVPNENVITITIYKGDADPELDDMLNG